MLCNKKQLGKSNKLINILKEREIYVKNNQNTRYQNFKP